MKPQSQSEPISEERAAELRAGIRGTPFQPCKGFNDFDLEVWDHNGEVIASIEVGDGEQAEALRQFFSASPAIYDMLREKLDEARILLASESQGRATTKAERRAIHSRDRPR